jgi:hypothetical protein
MAASPYAAGLVRALWDSGGELSVPASRHRASEAGGRHRGRWVHASARAAPDTPLAVRSAPAVEVLRHIWVQQHDGSASEPRWRCDRDVPPPAQSIHSPYDLEAHYSLKRGMAWVG